jgi:Glycosyl transferase family 90
MAIYPSPSSKRRSSGQHLKAPLRANETNQLYGNVRSTFDIVQEDTGEKLPTYNALLRRMRRRWLKPRSLAILVLVFCFAIITTIILNGSTQVTSARHVSVPPATEKRPGSPPVDLPRRPTTFNKPPSLPTSSHPMWTLITDAQRDFEGLKARQSKTLSEAVTEYRRRYGIPPPPNFDKWYNFAKENEVQLIDEYDSILQSLTPFWGLKPSTIRVRAKEALGYDNNLLGFLIRNGNATKIDGGREWMQDAIKGMTEKFIQYLPDMDLCFNVHDEPRVILQHDDLARLVSIAVDVNMRSANALEKPRNEWSRRPADLNDGRRIDEIHRTRFNRMNSQPTWTHARISCSPSSAARSLDENPQDDIDSYAVGPLGFIYNHTAFSDICASPSFASSYGFFNSPNAFSVVQDLFPVFSQSKISSFQDIIYPSPWYWYGKVSYDEKQDMEWREKESKMYWRGSTTGGYSRDGLWRNQHRQRFVQKINAADNTNILANGNARDESTPNWVTKEVFRPDYADLFDVKFSHIGQCDPGDCTAQREFFSVASPERQEKACKFKFLLDIDGNAFSGRFYAFLKSKSLVYKLALFKEWHSEIVKPWVHYVPLSLRGEEWVESVRWISGEKEGKAEGERLALAGREWADKVLRNEDMEAWFFRLLLE